MENIKNFLINESNQVDDAINAMFELFNDCENDNEMCEAIIDLLNGLTGNGKDDVLVKSIKDWVNNIK